MATNQVLRSGCWKQSFYFCTLACHQTTQVTKANCFPPVFTTWELRVLKSWEVVTTSQPMFLYHMKAMLKECAHLFWLMVAQLHIWNDRCRNCSILKLSKYISQNAGDRKGVSRGPQTHIKSKFLMKLTWGVECMHTVLPCGPLLLSTKSFGLDYCHCWMSFYISCMHFEWSVLGCCAQSHKSSPL